MSTSHHRLLTGTYTLIGKQPDGDSVRFAADNPALYADIHNGHRVDVSKHGTAQLRLEGIDAPELALWHGGPAAFRRAAGRAAHRARLHELRGGRARDRHRGAAQDGSRRDPDQGRRGQRAAGELRSHGGRGGGNGGRGRGGTSTMRSCCGR